MHDINKINIPIGPIQNSLFLPVVARALESRQSNPMLSDKTAMEIVEKVNCKYKN